MPVVEVLMTAATSSVWALWHINCSLEMCLTKLPMLVESPMDLWTMKQHVQIWSLGEMGAVVVKPIFELLFFGVCRSFSKFSFRNQSRLPDNNIKARSLQ